MQVRNVHSDPSFHQFPPQFPFLQGKRRVDVVEPEVRKQFEQMQEKSAVNASAKSAL